MEKKFERRDFLKSALFGLGTLFVIASPLKSFAKASKTNIVDPTTPDITLPNAILLSTQAKEFFYKKKYSESATIYQQLIASYPGRIAYYDGYAKVLGAQQKTLDVAELYRQGLQVNPDAPLFMHRLSLSMKDLCMGNRKAEKAFVNKYGETQLFEASALLLIKAIGLTQKNKGFHLNLRDTLKSLDKLNKNLDKRGLPGVQFSNVLRSEIMSKTAAYETKWAISRSKHKPNISDNAEADVEKIKGKERRALYSNKEKTERENLIQKAKKERWKHDLELNITNGNPNKVEKYGTFILEGNITDTDTIGKLRRFYRKTKSYNRLLALDRYLHLKNESLANTLAYAGSLNKYGNGGSDLSEVKQLLNTLEPYVQTLNPVSIGAYYQISAQVKIAEKQNDIARTILLKGLELFDGRGGVSFSMLENYAMSFTGKKTAVGIQLLYAICGKKTDAVDDPSWKYVKKYLQSQVEKATKETERLKPLYALAKLQKKVNDGGYALTKSEINSLRGKIYN